MRDVAARTIQNMAATKDDGPASRLRDLRKAQGLTQEAVAERGSLRTNEVTKVEGGYNQATSARVRSGLAAAFGLPMPVLSRYLDGKMTIDDVLRECRNPSARRPEEGGMGLAIPTSRVGLPHLEALAVVNEAEGTWSVWAVRLAMSGYFGWEDFTIPEWKERLTALDKALQRAAPSPPSQAKHLRRS